MSESKAPSDERYFPRRRIAEGLSPTFGWNWDLIGEEHHPEGIRSISGPIMRRCYRVRDRRTGREQLVGKGELTRYCGIPLSDPSR